MNDLLNKRKPYIIFNACLYFWVHFSYLWNGQFEIWGAASIFSRVYCNVSEKHLAFGNYRISEINILKELVMIRNRMPASSPLPFPKNVIFLTKKPYLGCGYSFWLVRDFFPNMQEIKYLHNVHLPFFDCLLLEEILGTLHNSDGCYSVADHMLSEVLLCSLVVLWLGEMQRSGLFGGLAEGEGGTRGPGSVKVRSTTALDLEKQGGRSGCCSYSEWLFTSSAPQARARRRLGACWCFLYGGESLRLKTLCPKLRSWDLVSWRDFFTLMARGLKSDSVRLLSKKVLLDAVWEGPVECSDS